MVNLKTIQNVNKHLNIFSAEDHRFNKYGRIISEYCCTPYMNLMENTNIPEEGNVYIAKDENLMNAPLTNLLCENLFGGMEIQAGYCNGRNSSLNALEYHKSSELNIAITDMILILGELKNIKHNKYNVKDTEVFHIPAGTIVELYQTTLHFAPCKVNQDGFKCIVVLPIGTNTLLEDKIDHKEDSDHLLFAKNKWLMAHPDNSRLLEKGAFPGLTGDNLHVNCL